jgi:S1-C subfamily serine protease
VHNFEELSKLVRTLKPGQKAAIKLLRDGKEMKVTVEFGVWK